MLARFLAQCTVILLTLKENLGANQVRGRKMKSSFLDLVKFEVPEGHTCESGDVQ